MKRKSLIFTITYMAALLVVIVSVVMISKGMKQAETPPVTPTEPVSTPKEQSTVLTDPTPDNPSVNMPLIVYLHGGSGKGDEPDQLLEIDGFIRSNRTM